MQNTATETLSKRTMRSTVLFIVFLWLAIFLPAGSLNYWQGWLFWAHFSAWAIVGAWYFLKHDPALVERRLRAGPTAEREPRQKVIQLAASILMCALFVGSALDHRFGWSTVPGAVVLIGNMLVAAGYLLMFIVFRENSFASSIIEVRADQKVISTGPYAVVRHPMYAGAVIMFAGVPLALGSWWGLLLIVFIVWALIARLTDEEAYLAQNLRGYDAYRSKVPYRLVPYLW